MLFEPVGNDQAIMRDLLHSEALPEVLYMQDTFLTEFPKFDGEDSIGWIA